MLKLKAGPILLSVMDEHWNRGKFVGASRERLVAKSVTVRCGVVEACLSPLRGLFLIPLFTHGLRRGLHSCAASRLKVASVPLRVATQL